MSCKEALSWIHDYLDGGLDANQSHRLSMHLQVCPACSSQMHHWEKTEAFVHNLNPVGAPSGLNTKIMLSLPPVKRSPSWVLWIRKHPAATAAAIFLFLMLGSVLSLWNQGTELIVRGNDLEGIIIEDQRVIIPLGHVVHGDLVVEHGTVQVAGDVEGNVVVIDGKIALASTAHISGRITQVDQTLDWLWFKLKDWLKLYTAYSEP